MFVQETKRELHSPIYDVEKIGCSFRDLLVETEDTTDDNVGYKENPIAQ